MQTQGYGQRQTGGLKDSQTNRYVWASSRQTRRHTGRLSAESAHLPAPKHFNHLMANYSGARQSRTETHTSLPLHSQMALQAGSPLPVCLHSTCLLSSQHTSLLLRVKRQWNKCVEKLQGVTEWDIHYKSKCYRCSILTCFPIIPVTTKKKWMV